MVPFLLVTALWLSDPHPYLDQMVALRRHLHQYPELSNRETGTHAHLRKLLLDAGFQDVRDIAGTGLKVVYDTGRPGRVMAFRADIDALPVEEATGLPFASSRPGVMHACGHDLHTAILFGLALSVKNDPVIGGSFVFLFQPCEEGPPPGEEGGASVMVAQGALENPVPDVIFGLHGMGRLPLGRIGLHAGGVMARADRFHVTVKGKGTHGSTPDQGVDALFVAAQIVTAAQAVVSRQTDPRDPVVVSFGSFQAGNRFNIIPGTAKLSGTIRTLSTATGDKVQQQLDRVIAGVTSAHGAQYVFENETMCPVTHNDPAWTEAARAVLEKADFEVRDVAPVMVAEDFAYYAEHIPAVYFFLGTCPSGDCPDIHQADYAPDERALQIGADLFKALAKAFADGEGP